ncbi:unnamed protein product, partial [Linum tenue]
VKRRPPAAAAAAWVCQWLLLVRSGESKRKARERERDGGVIHFAVSNSLGAGRELIASVTSPVPDCRRHLI